MFCVTETGIIIIINIKKNTQTVLNKRLTKIFSLTSNVNFFLPVFIVFVFIYYNITIQPLLTIIMLKNVLIQCMIFVWMYMYLKRGNFPHQKSNEFYSTKQKYKLNKLKGIYYFANKSNTIKIGSTYVVR